MNTKIKICGLTDPSEAAPLLEIGADFAGMVLFFPESRRCIDTQKAGEIIRALEGRTAPAAVMVSPSPDQVREACGTGFSILQIHGFLSEEALSAASVPVWKAFNVKDMDQRLKYREDPRVEAFVFDAALPGSGKRFDWDLLKDLPDPGKPFFLAGGLDETNVGEAVLRVRPFGVDVSSGVEYKDRKGKDPRRIRAFASAVRAADRLVMGEYQ